MNKNWLNYKREIDKFSIRVISNIPVTANEKEKISKGTEDTNGAINQTE